MALNIIPYKQIFVNLLEAPFKDSATSAQLVSASYVYDVEHTSAADFLPYVVGEPLLLTSKTITIDDEGATIIDFADLDFTGQGILQASGVIFHYGVGVSDDKLIAYSALDDTSFDQEVTATITLSTNGLVKIPFTIVI